MKQLINDLLNDKISIIEVFKVKTEKLEIIQKYYKNFGINKTTADSTEEFKDLHWKNC